MPKSIVVYVSKDRDALLGKYSELSTSDYDKHYCRPETYGPQNEVDLATRLVFNSSEGQHVVYTMYPNFLNKIGAYISDGKLENTCVSVYIVGDPKYDCNLDKSWFDSDGYLTNWPYGYLEPNYE